MKNSQYFRHAKAYVTERFAGVDGFNFGGGTYTTTSEPAQNVSKAVASSLPYEIRIENANGVLTTAVLFGSNKNRTAVNNGNPVGITVSSATANISYEEMLADTENKNVEFGVTYIEVESGSNAQLTATWQRVDKASYGEENRKPIPVKKSEYQQQSDVLTFNYHFTINGYVQLEIPIQANTTVVYSFYPAATVAPGRTLSNVHETMQYAKPTIGSAQNLSLTQSAIQALKG